MGTALKELANSEAHKVLLGESLDIEAVISLRHRLRQYRKEREAMGEIVQAIEESSSNREARLAAAYWALDNHEKAQTHATKAPREVTAVMILGLIAEERQDYEEALKYYRKAGEMAPSTGPCVLRQISALRQLGRVEEALSLIERLRREFSDQASLTYYEGRCLEDLGRYEEALACYQKAMEIDPTHAESIFHAARLCDLRGADEEAKKLYERIGPESPNAFIHASLNLALLYEDEEDYEKALKCAESVLKMIPTHRRAKLFRDTAKASMTMYYSPEETKQTERLEAVLRIPVSDFELSVRSRNCLAKMNINTLGDLVKKTESEMLAYKNFGETSLREIREVLASKGLRLGMFREDAATRAAVGRSEARAQEEVLAKSIDELELSVRSRKCMDALGVRTIKDLMELGEERLCQAKNFGRVSLNEIKKKLRELGLTLPSKKDK